MRKTMLAAILATVAFTPFAAAAQDRPDGERRRGGYNSDGGARTPRYDRQQGAQRVEQPQQVQAAPQPQVVQQPQQQQRQWQGNRDGGRRNWNNAGDASSRGARVQQPQQPAPVQAAPVQQQQQQVDRSQRRSFDGNRGNDSNRGYNRTQPNQYNGGNTGNRGQVDRRAQQPNRDWNGNRGYSGNDRNYGRRPDYNRNWRSNNRYDWQRYRTTNRQAFRLPRYYAPYGWGYGYRRFSIGAYLDQGLFERSYWIDSPYDYRLPDVEWPYRWVRYYNDALLVDTESGEVVDVISDIFW